MQKIVAIAAVVVQQNCATLGLSQEQVCAAVAIKVSGEQGTRRGQMDGAQTDLIAYIFESILSQVTEQPEFSMPLDAFTHRCQVNPAIIVVIQRGHAPGAPPILDREFHLLDALP